MSNYDEMIAILQAAKDGRIVQFRQHDTLDEWQESPAYWDFSLYDFRVKQEPREWWINVNWNNHGFVHPTKKSAQQNAARDAAGKAIHVREVIE